MGMTYIFTGNGKGKTTAAFGMAFRYLGHGKNVVVVQFMKGKKTGEVSFIEDRNISGIEIKQFGRDRFVNLKNPSEEDINLAKEAMDYARETVKKRKTDLIVLDELNVAVHAGLVSEKDVLNFIDELPKETDLVITGRWARKSIVDRADLVTEMKEIKHPFQKGISAKKGAEY
ncbi:MAG: cob(I)yrinic acid a,c-diamide adenosyltransferase [Candidatus Aenigmarchaeota archaeon]|nr:cob(I)yrinic acid a,c-diamide adenosyltransferase [Candidatus Aenigmarchaeota archaeon]